MEVLPQSIATDLRMDLPSLVEGRFLGESMDTIDQCRITECDCCGRWVPADEISHVPYGEGNLVGDCAACEQCTEPPQWVRDYLK